MRITYQSTISAENYACFRKSNFLDFLIYTATSDGPDHAISLVILMRLSSDKECSQMISQSPVFTSQNVKKMFVEAANNANADSAILLHLIRNIADHREEPRLDREERGEEDVDEVSSKCTQDTISATDHLRKLLCEETESRRRGV